MKKYFIGLFSIVLLVASILGAQSKAPKSQERAPERSGRGSEPVLWV